MKEKPSKSNDKPPLRHRIKQALLKFLRLIFNPRLLLCFGIAWLVTNGWAYIALGISIFANITWLGAVASVYLSALWFPFTPEKIVTVVIAIWLLNRLFPGDQKTLAVLKEELEKVKNAARKQKQKRQQKKEVPADHSEQEPPRGEQNEQKK